MPSETSAATSDSRTPSRSTGIGGIRAVNAAEASTSPAVTVVAAAGPDAASKAPPSAGPAKKPTLWMADDATFAAVSSTGVVASCGIKPAKAGSAGVATRLIEAASAITRASGA